MRHLALPLLITAQLMACASQRPAMAPLPEDGYPGTLMLPAELGADFMMRQSLEAKYEEREVGFSAVLQKTGDKLLMLGLTPFGTRAFKLEQIGEEITFDKYVPNEMPFPPKFMLLDLQRTLFIGLPGAPLADGEHTGARDGETITETWSQGKLQQRAFTRDDGEPAGAIRIDYGDGYVLGAPPKIIRFDNGWFGYSLVITTTETKAL